MDFRQKLRVGACICAIGLGVGVEVGQGHAVFCPQYRKDVVLCGTVIEAIIPPHTHTEIGTPSVAGSGTVFASTSVGTTHERRLGENLFLSDGDVSAKLA